MLRRKKSKADAVKDSATELQEKATETLAPKISDARDAAGSALDSVREEVPKLRDELAAAVAASAVVDSGDDSDDADDDAPKKKKKRGGKLKKLILVAGIGGAAAFVAKKVKDSQSGAPVPPPAPRPTPAPEPATPSRPTDGGSETNSTQP